MDNPYNEGWSDASKHFIETHIATEEFTGLLDKFFDKISDLKEIINLFYTHHEGFDILGNEIKDEIQREKNLNQILQKVKRLETHERKQKNVTKKTKKTV